MLLNSLERVNNRIKGKPVDRVPNLNIIMQFAARYIGVNYGKYCTDYRYLVEANIKCCRDFGIDMLSVISDPFRETASFGTNITINFDDTPSCKDHLIKECADIKNLIVPDPLSSERMLDRIKAVELYSKDAKGEFPILGWVEGPLAEACDLRGISNMLVDILEEPDFANELMEICLEGAVRFSREQIKAGAHYIGVGDAAASLVGPEIYKSTILPFEMRLVDEIHRLGARVKLHICGNIANILRYVPLSGADIIDIDWMVDFKEAVRVMKGAASACGNYDPVRILLQGGREDVEKSVCECLKAADGRTFIAAGCEVPKYTPVENLKAVYETLAHTRI